MKNETTETFLRWLEAQDPITKSFHLPKPEEAGFLAAVRLRHTHYRKREVGARHPLAKTCEKKTGGSRSARSRTATCSS